MKYPSILMRLLIKTTQRVAVFGRASATIIVLLLAGLTGQQQVVNAAEKIAVSLDQAKVLQLPPNTATIIIGNPLIAGITMINRNTQLILTGKSYGQTNMIALDNVGNSIGESTIVVKGSRTGLLVQRGMIQETYSCEPKCQPTVTLGDNVKYSGAVLSASQQRAAAAASSAKK